MNSSYKIKDNYTIIHSPRESPREDTSISLGRGNRDFLSELRVSGDENMSNQVGGLQRGRGTERDYWKGGGYLEAR